MEIKKNSPNIKNSVIYLLELIKNNYKEAEQ